MILMIDNYDSFTYNLVQAFQILKKEVIVKRNDCVTIEEIDALHPEAIVLSPGPGRPESAGRCLEILRYFSGKYPILGICLGHQIIAQAFGAKVIASSQLMHGKSSFVFHHGKDLYKKMSLPFQAGRYHSLCVDKSTLPACLIVESETINEEIMGIRHITHPIFGLQFHPESLLTSEGLQLLKNFTDEVLEGVC